MSTLAVRPILVLYICVCIVQMPSFISHWRDKYRSTQDPSTLAVQVSGLSHKLEAALDAITSGATPASPALPSRRLVQPPAAAASAPPDISSKPDSSASPLVPRRVRVLDEITGWVQIFQNVALRIL